MSEVNDNSIMTEEDYEKHELDHYEESAKFIKLFHGQFRKMSYKLANRKKRAVVRVLEAMSRAGELTTTQGILRSLSDGNYED